MVFVIRGIVTFLGLLYAVFTYSQCPADPDEKGLFTHRIDKDQYPYTTFYRPDKNGSIKYNGNLEFSFDTFRQRLSNLIVLGNPSNPQNEATIPYSVYSKLHSLAVGSVVS
ncbi:MAG: hypothetical protein KDC92_04095 [Bacteroidetes bacterium]|nr:hypothetical protein [Bacteroidota bacterium]